VLLFPDAELAIDVAIFDELSCAALTDNDPNSAWAAIAHYTGELLPDDRYAEWAAERRELLRLRHLSLLRLAGQWMRVSDLDPSDEDAHLHLMRQQVANGDGGTALLQYERLARILDREQGVGPGSALREFRDQLESVIAPTVATGLEPHVVEALVAELADVTRRQATLLETLAAADLTPAAASSPRPAR
jgi:DNA-binding SARP family transcriptional activator